MKKACIEKLEAILQSAYSPAWEWLEVQPDYATAWKNCHRGDWLLWLLEKADYDENKLRLMTCHIVRETPLGDGRTAWDLLTDERSRKAIEVAEAYALGKAKRSELTAAATAAYAAAYAAHATAYAAYAAAGVAHTLDSADAAAGAAGAVAGTLDSATTTAQSGRQTMCAHKYHGMSLKN